MSQDVYNNNQLRVYAFSKNIICLVGLLTKIAYEMLFYQKTEVC